MAVAGAGGRSSAQCRGMMFNRLSCVRCSSCFAHADAEPRDGGGRCSHRLTHSGRCIARATALTRHGRCTGPPGPSLPVQLQGEERGVPESGGQAAAERSALHPALGRVELEA
jgi:hypothetical protein